MSIWTTKDLLPHQIKQALVGRALQRFLTRRNRAFSMPRGEVLTNAKRIFVDVSVISKHDAGTGIQRVVRALALGLSERSETLECELHFVAAGRDTPYHTISWPDRGKLAQSTQIVGHPGDVFIGLDYSLDDVRWNAEQLVRFRRQGGKLWFLIHDLLPLEKPYWFSRNTVIRYRAWFDILATLSDGFLCNSLQTENDLLLAMRHVYGITSGYGTKVLPMGYKITDQQQNDEIPSARLAELLRITPDYFLQVGTLEPRKGHADVLDAFDALWSDGFPEGLVFVGQRGWQVDDLYDRIAAHPMNGRKLFWFDQVDDPELDQIYRGCKGSIIASLAEGFGLPLIEALGHSKPVLARDLVVFRQHEDCGVEYFPNVHDPVVLSTTIKQWSDAIANGRISVTAPEKGWDDSVSELLQAVT